MHIARWPKVEKTSLGLALFAAALLAPSLSTAQSASGTLDRVRASGKITFGYYPRGQAVVVPEFAPAMPMATPSRCAAASPPW